MHAREILSYFPPRCLIFPSKSGSSGNITLRMPLILWLPRIQVILTQFSLHTVISQNTPMGDELKWLLKEGGGRIFESCDISLENTLTSHAVSLALVICTWSDSAMPLLSCACLLTQ